MATNLQANFDITEANNLFKTDFKEYAENVYNNDMLLWSQIDKPEMTGKKTEFPVPFGYQGGISMGTLGEANVADYQDVNFTHNKLYGVSRVARDSIAASMSSKGAFVRAMQETIDKTVEMMEWLFSQVLWGNGDGSLGTALSSSAVTDNGGGDYDVIMGESATDFTNFKEANFEERLFVNFGSGSDLFEITSVTPSTRTISVQREAGGTDVPADGDVVYLQRSKDAAPNGIRQVLDATSGSLYDVTVGRRWQAFQNAVSAAIDFNVINDALAENQKKVGKKNMVNLAATSYTQMAKIMNLSEDQKRYEIVNLKPKGMEGLKNVVGFDGIQIMTPNGPIKLFAEKFVEDDRLYMLNTNQIKAYTMPKSGWVTDDGTTYLRVADEDNFEARYAWYGQIYIAPTYQVVLTGLSTS